jgi:hypothetical protein
VNKIVDTDGLEDLARCDILYVEKKVKRALKKSN